MHVQDVDELLALPARLALVATVADGRRWSFSALGDETGLADGNLHVQARRLVEAGYLERATQRRGNRKVTVFALTPRGRAAFEDHLAALRKALSSGGPGGSPAPRGELGPRVDASRVW